jgi:hypothetical protein
MVTSEGSIIRLRGRGKRLRRPRQLNAFWKALKRNWSKLANERIDDTSPVIPLRKCFWPFSKMEVFVYRVRSPCLGKPVREWQRLTL